MTVIGRRRDKDGSTTEAPMIPSEVKSEDGELDPRHEAMKDFHMASQSGDTVRMMQAMSNFNSLPQMDDTEDAD